MKIKPILLAPLVVILFVSAILIANMWELPSMQHEFAEAKGESQEVQVIVEGLRCRGTSNFFVSMIKDVPGILGVSTYVQEKRAVIDYDISQINLDEIKKAIESPVQLQDGRIVTPFKILEILE